MPSRMPSSTTPPCCCTPISSHTRRRPPTRRRPRPNASRAPTPVAARQAGTSAAREQGTTLHRPALPTPRLPRRAAAAWAGSAAPPLRHARLSSWPPTVASHLKPHANPHPRPYPHSHPHPDLTHQACLRQCVLTSSSLADLPPSHASLPLPRAPCAQLPSQRHRSTSSTASKLGGAPAASPVPLQRAPTLLARRATAADRPAFESVRAQMPPPSPAASGRASSHAGSSSSPPSTRAEAARSQTMIGPPS
jgi:hypothetical protein